MFSVRTNSSVSVTATVRIATPNASLNGYCRGGPGNSASN